LSNARAIFVPANGTDAVHFPGARLCANADSPGLSTTADAAVHTRDAVSDAVARLPNHRGNAVSNTAAWLSDAGASGLPDNTVAWLSDAAVSHAAAWLSDAAAYLPDAGAALSDVNTRLPDAGAYLSDADDQRASLCSTSHPESTAVCSFTCSGMRGISWRTWGSG
jgi:hypothetical protein